jgi:Tol biopolymer transport system component
MWLAGLAAAFLPFAVAGCGDDNGGTNPPTTGSLEVSTVTTGTDIDADGYTVTVDGGSSQAIDANGTVTVSNLSAGDHVVLLGGVAANCTVAGDNPRTVAVAAGSTASTTFSVACVAETGDLEVSAATTGDDQDDAYTVSVDGGAAQAIDANGTLTFPDLTPGDYEVTLGDIAANCVTSNNPRTVAVAAGGTASTTFDVACTSQVGDLTVTTATTGNGVPAGYTFTVDGGPSLTIGASASVPLTGLAAGDHVVELGDIPANCSVDGDNPVTVDVPADGLGTATFNVTCQAGSLAVTTQSVGLAIDGDGYQVAVDGGTGVAVGVNATVTLSDEAVGDRSVELSGLAANCSVTGDNPVTATVVDGQSTDVKFDVFCWQALSNQVAFQSDRFANDDIFVMGTNGSNQTIMTASTANDIQPAVAISGTIAFVSDRDGTNRIYLMDGAGIRRMTVAGAQEVDPSWSGDGVRVAYARRSSGLVAWDVYVSNVDGTNTTNLTNAAGSQDDQPAFSADGSKILFRSDRSGNADIWVMNADGSGATQLTTDGGEDGKPAWSPDGSQILWVTNRTGNYEIFKADYDAGLGTLSNLVNLTNDPGSDFMPDWKSDGSSIAFASDRSGDFEVYRMNSDGSSVQNLTNRSGSDLEPAWTP